MCFQTKDDGHDGLRSSTILAHMELLFNFEVRELDLALSRLMTHHLWTTERRMGLLLEDGSDEI